VNIIINLAPHREQERKLESQKSIAYMLMFLLIPAGISWLGYAHYNVELQHAQQDMNYLNAKNIMLKKEIITVKNLIKDEKNLEDRAKIIPMLQSERSTPVKILSELANIVPHSLYISNYSQNNGIVTINGYAQSNSAVALLMDNIKLRTLLFNPTLDIIQKQKSGKGNIYRFTMQMNVHKKKSTKNKGAAK
jgi:type IV pilus assembly protein PilN